MFTICVIILFWYLFNAGIIPLALAICGTIGGVLSCVSVSVNYYVKNSRN